MKIRKIAKNVCKVLNEVFKSQKVSFSVEEFEAQDTDGSVTLDEYIYLDQGDIPLIGFGFVRADFFPSHEEKHASKRVYYGTVLTHASRFKDLHWPYVAKAMEAALLQANDLTIMVGISTEKDAEGNPFPGITTDFNPNSKLVSTYAPTIEVGTDERLSQSIDPTQVEIDSVNKLVESAKVVFSGSFTPSTAWAVAFKYYNLLTSVSDDVQMLLKPVEDMLAAHGFKFSDTQYLLAEGKERENYILGILSNMTAKERAAHIEVLALQGLEEWSVVSKKFANSLGLRIKRKWDAAESMKQLQTYVEELINPTPKVEEEKKAPKRTPKKTGTKTEITVDTSKNEEKPKRTPKKRTVKKAPVKKTVKK